MGAFMNYFGQDQGFFSCLLIYFPLSVIVFSLLLTVVTRRAYLAPIIVGVVFGGFFVYAYSQFNATAGNFVIPCVAYIIISTLLSLLAKIPFRKKEE